MRRRSSPHKSVAWVWERLVERKGSRKQKSMASETRNQGPSRPGLDERDSLLGV